MKVRALVSDPTKQSGPRNFKSSGNLGAGVMSSSYQEEWAPKTAQGGSAVHRQMRIDDESCGPSKPQLVKPSQNQTDTGIAAQTVTVARGPGAPLDDADRLTQKLERSEPPSASDRTRKVIKVCPAPPTADQQRAAQGADPTPAGPLRQVLQDIQASAMRFEESDTSLPSPMKDIQQPKLASRQTDELPLQGTLFLRNKISQADSSPAHSPTLRKDRSDNTNDQQLLKTAYLDPADFFAESPVASARRMSKDQQDSPRQEHGLEPGVQIIDITAGATKVATDAPRDSAVRAHRDQESLTNTRFENEAIRHVTDSPQIVEVPELAKPMNEPVARGSRIDRLGGGNQQAQGTKDARMNVTSESWVKGVTEQMSVQNLHRNLRMTQSKSVFRRATAEGGARRKLPNARSATQSSQNANGSTGNRKSKVKSSKLLRQSLEKNLLIKKLHEQASQLVAIQSSDSQARRNPYEEERPDPNAGAAIILEGPSPTHHDPKLGTKASVKQFELNLAGLTAENEHQVPSYQNVTETRRMKNTNEQSKQRRIEHASPSHQDVSPGQKRSAKCSPADGSAVLGEKKTNLMPNENSKSRNLRPSKSQMNQRHAHTGLEPQVMSFNSRQSYNDNSELVVKQASSSCSKSPGNKSLMKSSKLAKSKAQTPINLSTLKLQNSQVSNNPFLAVQHRQISANDIRQKQEIRKQLRNETQKRMKASPCSKRPSVVDSVDGGITTKHIDLDTYIEQQHAQNERTATHEISTIKDDLEANSLGRKASSSIYHADIIQVMKDSIQKSSGSLDRFQIEEREDEESPGKHHENLIIVNQSDQSSKLMTNRQQDSQLHLQEAKKLTTSQDLTEREDNGTSEVLLSKVSPSNSLHLQSSVRNKLSKIKMKIETNDACRTLDELDCVYDSKEKGKQAAESSETLGVRKENREPTTIFDNQSAGMDAPSIQQDLQQSGELRQRRKSQTSNDVLLNQQSSPIKQNAVINQDPLTQKMVSKDIQITGKKIEQKSIMSIIHNRSSRVRSPADNQSKNNQDIIDASNLAQDVLAKTVKPKSQQKSRMRHIKKGALSNHHHKGNDSRLDVSDASTLKRTSFMDFPENIPDQRPDTLAVSEVQYKVSPNNKDKSGEDSNISRPPVVDSPGLRQASLLQMKPTQKSLDQALTISKVEIQEEKRESPLSTNKARWATEKDLLLTESYSIILAQQQMAANGIQFSELDQDQQTQLLVEQHNILQNIQMQHNLRNLESTGDERTRIAEAGPTMDEIHPTQLTEEDEGGQGQEPPKSHQRKYEDDILKDSRSRDELHKKSKSECSSKQQHFDARNTGVGTDELEQLIRPLSELHIETGSENDQQIIISVSQFDDGDRARQLKLLDNEALNESSSDLKIAQPRVSITKSENQAFMLTNTFASFLGSLSESEKQQLYEHQVSKAYQLQVLSQPANQPQSTEMSDDQSVFKLQTRKKKQLKSKGLSRIIINNALGQNEVVKIGSDKKVNAVIQRYQQHFEVMGESVDIIKGTGPGSAMGVLSKEQQQYLISKTEMAEQAIQSKLLSDQQQSSVAERSLSPNLAENTAAQPVSPLSSGKPHSSFSPSRNVIRQNIRNVSQKRKSVEDLKRQHQLLCDTVIKRRRVLEDSLQQESSMQEIKSKKMFITRLRELQQSLQNQLKGFASSRQSQISDQLRRHIVSLKNASRDGIGQMQDASGSQSYAGQKLFSVEKSTLSEHQIESPNYLHNHGPEGQGAGNEPSERQLTHLQVQVNNEEHETPVRQLQLVPQQFSQIEEASPLPMMSRLKDNNSPLKLQRAANLSKSSASRDVTHRSGGQPLAAAASKHGLQGTSCIKQSTPKLLQLDQCVLAQNSSSSEINAIQRPDNLSQATFNAGKNIRDLIRHSPRVGTAQSIKAVHTPMSNKLIVESFGPSPFVSNLRNTQPPKVQIRNAMGRVVKGPKSPMSNKTSNCPTLTRGFGQLSPAMSDDIIDINSVGEIVTKPIAFMSNEHQPESNHVSGQFTPDNAKMMQRNSRSSEMAAQKSAQYQQNNSKQKSQPHLLSQRKYYYVNKEQEKEQLKQFAQKPEGILQASMKPNTALNLNPSSSQNASHQMQRIMTAGIKSRGQETLHGSGMGTASLLGERASSSKMMLTPNRVSLTRTAQQQRSFKIKEEHVDVAQYFQRQKSSETNIGLLSKISNDLKKAMSSSSNVVSKNPNQLVANLLNSGRQSSSRRDENKKMMMANLLNNFQSYCGDHPAKPKEMSIEQNYPGNRDSVAANDTHSPYFTLQKADVQPQLSNRASLQVVQPMQLLNQDLPGEPHKDNLSEQLRQRQVRELQGSYNQTEEHSQLNIDVNHMELFQNHSQLQTSLYGREIDQSTVVGSTKLDRYTAPKASHLGVEKKADVLHTSFYKPKTPVTMTSFKHNRYAKNAKPTSQSTHKRTQAHKLKLSQNIKQLVSEKGLHQSGNTRNKVLFNQLNFNKDPACLHQVQSMVVKDSMKLGLQVDTGQTGDGFFDRRLPPSAQGLHPYSLSSTQAAGRPGRSALQTSQSPHRLTASHFHQLRLSQESGPPYSNLAALPRADRLAQSAQHFAGRNKLKKGRVLLSRAGAGRSNGIKLKT